MTDKINNKEILCSSEEEVYEKLGMSWIPPEIREGTIEINLALEGKLPRLVEVGDIEGDLQIHSTWSDGKRSIKAVSYTHLDVYKRQPVRYLCNALGVQDAEISWDQVSGSITVIHEDSSIKLAVGSASLLVNGREETMDVTPLLQEEDVYKRQVTKYAFWC